MTLTRKGFSEADEEFSRALNEERDTAEEHLHARLDERHRHDPWPVSPIFARLARPFRPAPTGDPFRPPPPGRDTAAISGGISPPVGHVGVAALLSHTSDRSSPR